MFDNGQRWRAGGVSRGRRRSSRRAGNGDCSAEHGDDRDRASNPGRQALTARHPAPQDADEPAVEPIVGRVGGRQHALEERARHAHDGERPEHGDLRRQLGRERSDEKRRHEADGDGVDDPRDASLGDRPRSVIMKNSNT
jgi:hypothetical protein